MKKYFLTMLLVILPLALAFAVEDDGDSDTEITADNEVLKDLSLFIPPKDVAFNPVIGSWARYTLEDKINKTRYELTIAVVGEERVEQGMANWVEISTTSSKGTPIIIKYLWVPSSHDSEVLRMLVQAGNYPPVEMNTHKRKNEKNRHVEGKFIKLGSELVKTYKEKIKTSTYKHKLENGETIQLWANSKVTPFGIVRSISLSHELVLLDYGLGHKSKVIKDPIKIDEERVAE